MASSTAKAVIINDVNFTTVYTGDALPQNSDPRWASTGAFASVANGVLTINTEPSQSTYYTTGSGSTPTPWNTGWSPTISGATIEFQMQVGEIASSATYATNISFGNGSKGYSLSFTTTGIVVGNSFGTFALDTTSDFVTYRIVMSADEFSAQTVSLYINNSSTPLFTGYAGGNTSSQNFVRFGDASNSVGGVSQWDYVAFTNAGAYAPIPEPAVKGLLLMAALGTFTYKRLRKRSK